MEARVIRLEIAIVVHNKNHTGILQWNRYTKEKSMWKGRSSKNGIDKGSKEVDGRYNTVWWKDKIVTELGTRYGCNR